MSVTGIQLFLYTVRVVLTVGLFSFFFLLVCIFPAQAAVTHYLINDDFTSVVPPTSGTGYILYHKTILIDYKGGKVFLSRESDGTGEITVGDAIQVSNNTGNSFFFRSSPNCFQSKKLAPVDITYLVRPGLNNLLVRYSDWCGGAKQIGKAHLVYKDQAEYGVAPFLRLPWDYRAKGISFTDAAYAMTSYFDHEYPLLSMSLAEPPVASQSVVTYQGGERSFELEYSRHDGYDWAKGAKAIIGEPILAAASGWAVYVDTCGACGNAVHIDHGNGFQTRYYHMQKDGLITTTPGEKVQVIEGQPIGKIGASGNVWPRGDAGAHIHFMVVQDKDSDGSFEDNIPDGVTDPFGWESKEPDPWEVYEFSFSDEIKKGNKSQYLWKDTIASTKVAIPRTGGNVTVNGHKVTFPGGYLRDQGIVEVKASPLASATDKVRGVSSGLIITVTDIFGNFVTEFREPLTMTWDFSKVDLTNVDTDTLSLYSSTDGLNWNKEATQIDLINKKATSQVNHLTEFALMAELRDMIAPNTTHTIVSNNTGTYLVLHSQDNEDGIGVEYTMYKIGENEWEIYSTPVPLHGNSFQIQYYSADIGENIEEVKEATISLDTSPPVTAAIIAGNEGETNWYNSSVFIELSAEDNENGSGVKELYFALDGREWSIYESTIGVQEEGEHTIQFYAVDVAGNNEEVKNKTFFIDKTSPEANIFFNEKSLSFTVTNTDSNSTPVQMIQLGEEAEFIVLDKAGNRLRIIGTLSNISLIRSLSLTSLQYNNDPLLLLAQNKFTADYALDKADASLRKFDQRYDEKNEMKLSLRYSAQTGITKVMIKEDGQEKIKEELQGIKVLHIYTDRGTLKYSY